ncbi:MAG: sensor histidine kinase, partial [Acidimicrobiales bacterium]|nr:sensor histidine kinase [Acidimicrobiales bacterium]
AALAAYKSALARQGALAAGAAELGGWGSTDTVELYREARTAASQAEAQLESLSGKTRKGEVRDAMASDTSEVFVSITDGLAEVPADGTIRVDAAAFTPTAATVVEDLHAVESAMYDQLIAGAQAARSTAERASNLFLITAVVGIIVAAGAAVVLGSRITKPLRRLTDAADTLSGEQMPKLIESLKNPAADEVGFQIGAMKPIDIRSEDELGQLARSFNEVQRVAGQVAAEQAQLLRKGIGEMFVNLARRNQALLDRQIEFIDELERGEEDPDQLQNLYRLDHLATRMRRNAESLLVLAGAEPPRRRGRPAPLANVVRAALAEVEDFNRIELLSFDEVLVASNAAADLAHLLSELMENATNFSPPETRVEVVGHKTKADGYVISITDHGIGMSADQIAEANESLARPPLVGLAMSRSLGFIVVGRLAARHGIAVRMMPSTAGGVTAVVSIPPSLVVDTPGAVAEADPEFEPPARLKPVLESPTSGLPPLTFEPEDGAVEAAPPSTPAPAAAPAAAEPSPASRAPEPVSWEPEPAASPAPAAESQDEPKHTVPTHSIFDDPAPAAAAADDDAAIAAQVDEAVEPAMPAALSFEAPDEPLPEPVATPPVSASAHLDGPPPQAPTPNRPFFLADAEPPRRFGEAAAPESKAAPAPEPAPAPTTPKLFGTAPVAPAPAPERNGGPVPSAPAVPAAEGKLAQRRPASRPPSAPKLDTPPPAAPRSPAATTPPAAPAPEAPEAAAAPAEPVEKTSTGLAKRVPRSAGGSRAIPGSETERGVSATRRSPEEIRNMLSSHSAGRQRARTTQPVSTGPSQESESDD